MIAFALTARGVDPCSRSQRSLRVHCLRAERAPTAAEYTPGAWPRYCFLFPCTASTNTENDTRYSSIDHTYIDHSHHGFSHLKIRQGTSVRFLRNGRGDGLNFSRGDVSRRANWCTLTASDQSAAGLEQGLKLQSLCDCLLLYTSSLAERSTVSQN